MTPYLAVVSAVCQSGSNWGPWKYAKPLVSGVEFRTRCVGDMPGAESLWEYQFRSRFSVAVSFAVQHDEILANHKGNGPGVRRSISLEPKQLTPILQQRLSGTCAEVKRMHIEVFCISHALDYDADPCFRDENGNVIPQESLPKNP